MRNPAFGAYLKQLRESKNIPQQTVAQSLRIDNTTLSKIELGQRSCVIEMLPAFAKALDCDFKELQLKFIAERILSEFNGQPYFVESIENLLTKIK